jgi:hypothetical protein
MNLPGYPAKTNQAVTFMPPATTVTRLGLWKNSADCGDLSTCDEFVADP